MWHRQSAGEMWCKGYTKSYKYIIIHSVMFFLLGIFLPDQLLSVVVGSVAYEAVEGMLLTFQTGCWQDVFVNTIAYSLGSCIGKMCKRQT